MILPNNPRVDVEELNVRVAMIRAQRREEPMAHDRTESATRGEGPDTRAAALAPATPGAQAPAGQPGSSLPPDHDGPADRLGHASTRTMAPAAPIPGWRARLKALPLAGGLVAFLHALVRLPRFRHDVVEVHEILRTELRRLGHDQAQLRRTLAETTESQAQRIRDLEDRRSFLEDRLESQTRELRRLEHALEAANLASARLVRETGAAVCATREALDGAAAHASLLEGFYVAFEDRFRGPRESIGARLRPYLAQVRQATAGRPGARCVDIGCGRGEWLKLLVEEGFAPIGLDLDPDMVHAARRAGVEAHVGDGIAWLEQQPQASVDVITAFQVIEHLSFERLVRLLDAALRALAPNGVAIFETPNPENLLVATNTFYLDPTHHRPIPPPLAQFLARQRGFPRVELVSLNAFPVEMQIAGEDELTRRINQLLYGAQDYALVAWKKRAEPAA